MGTWSLKACKSGRSGLLPATPVMATTCAARALISAILVASIATTCSQTTGGTFAMHSPWEALAVPPQDLAELAPPVQLNACRLFASDVNITSALNRRLVPFDLSTFFALNRMHAAAHAPLRSALLSLLCWPKRLLVQDKLTKLGMSGTIGLEPTQRIIFPMELELLPTYPSTCHSVESCVCPLV